VQPEEKIISPMAFEGLCKGLGWFWDNLSEFLAIIHSMKSIICPIITVRKVIFLRATIY